jgi:lipopolysaccharide exporter
MKVSQLGVRAVKWGSALAVAKFTVQFAAQVYLARLLGPEVVGLFALALVVLMFVNFVGDFGFGWGLIQRVDLKDEDVRFAFTWQVLTGIGAGLILFSCATLVARWFGEPRLEPIVQYLSIATVLIAAGAPATNLLRRSMDFKTIGVVQLVSYVAGYICVGLPMALAGNGVYSLVAAWLVQAGVSAVLTYSAVRHSILPLLWYAGARRMIGVSVLVFVTNIVNWAFTNADRLILGRISNVRNVGLYSVGYNLALLPNTVLMNVLQPVFLAAGSRLQDDRVAMKRAYLEVLSAAWVLVVPLFVLLSAVASPLVAMLYGPAWASSGDVLAVLALSMAAVLTCGVSTPVLWNTGRNRYEVLTTVPLLVLLVGGLSVTAALGPLAVAVCVAVVCAVRASLITAIALRAVNADTREWGPDFLRGLLLSVVIGVFGVGSQWVLSKFGVLAPWAHCLAGASAGLTVCAVVVLSVPKALGPAASNVLLRFVRSGKGLSRIRAASAPG